MAALLADNLPVPPPNEALLALGIEGSANKVGVGLIRYVPATGAYDILANPRETYVTPPGTGFRPRETAQHHQRHVVPLVQKCLREAGVDGAQVALEGLPPRCSQMIMGLRPALSLHLFGIHIPSLAESPKVSDEVSIAHLQSGLEILEGPGFSPGSQQGDNPKPTFLVNHPVKL